LTGTASISSTAVIADTTAATSLCALLESATGNLAVKTDAGCAYNASNGTLTVTTLAGAVTGSTGSFSGLLTANASFDVKNGATSSGVLSVFEDSDDGSNKATFQVPALAANTVYTLPADDGDAGEVLQTNGSGTLTWAGSYHCFDFFPTTVDGDVVAGTDLYRLPVRKAFTLTDVYGYVNATGSTDVVTIDLNESISGTVLSTKLTIDAGENHSTTALAPAVISDSAIAANSVLSVDVDDQDGGNTAAGLIVQACGYFN